MQATIHNEFLTLTVDTHGAEAVSLKNAADEEMLWQADPAVWKRHAPILFPWTGKLPGGTFEVDGKTYKGGQHGFARDMEHTLLKAEGDTIQLELRSDDAIKAERFPFDFVLTSTFRLDGKTVHHTLTVRNPGTEELRFGIGYHPAFNIPFDAQHTTTDYEFRFDQPESPVILDARPNGLLSGKCYYQWKNQQAIQLRMICSQTTASAWRACAPRPLASMRRAPAARSPAMWKVTPTRSSGRPLQSWCGLCALSRGTACPPPRLTRSSGASVPLPPALPRVKAGRPR